jgi:hypothetical protein
MILLTVLWSMLLAASVVAWAFRNRRARKDSGPISLGLSASSRNAQHSRAA